MTRLLRNPRGLILLFSPLLLAGCQAPLAPSMSAQQPDRASQVLLEAKAVALVDQPNFRSTSSAKADAIPSTTTSASLKPKDSAPVTDATKNPDGLTGQLADSLMNVFKTFTGRQ
jgi:hypothetical protein